MIMFLSAATVILNATVQPTAINHVRQITIQH